MLRDVYIGGERQRGDRIGVGRRGRHRDAIDGRQALVAGPLRGADHRAARRPWRRSSAGHRSTGRANAARGRQQRPDGDVAIDAASGVEVEEGGPGAGAVAKDPFRVADVWRRGPVREHDVGGLEHFQLVAVDGGLVDDEGIADLRVYALAVRTGIDGAGGGAGQRRASGRRVRSRRMEDAMSSRRFLWRFTNRINNPAAISCRIRFPNLIISN